MSPGTSTLEPTPEQTAVREAPLEPALVLAGAGSGKTTTMAERVVRLVADGSVAPEQVLGLTFTRKAAAELAAKVRRRLAGMAAEGGLPHADGEPTVSTYHAYAARLYTEHALRLGHEPGARLITPAVSWQLMTRVVQAYDGPMDAVAWAPGTVVEAALALAGELGEHLRAPEDLRRFGDELRKRVDRQACASRTGRPPAPVKAMLTCQRVREQLLPLVERYEEVKRSRELLDHADQVALAARVAQRFGVVGRAERERYRAVLLDEYQDTGHAQRVLLTSLFGEGHPVTAVGDPCQSIYGWRGASPGGLATFPRDFPTAAGPPAAVRTLSVSFRNGERILSVANRLSTELRAAGLRVPVLRPGPDGVGDGAARCALLRTVDDEARWVAEQVEAALRSTPRDGAAALAPGDVAVLARKRSQFPRLRAALEARGLPVEVVGLGGLLTVPEVGDVVATLRVLCEPTANAAVVRLLTGPRWRLGPRDLAALGRRSRSLAASARAGADGDGDPPDAVALAVAGADEAEVGSLADALDDLGSLAAYSPEGGRRLLVLRDELRALRRRVGQPLADLVVDVERTLGLDVEVVALRPDRSPAAARADLDAFADVAAEFAGDDQEATLPAFLAYLTAAETQEFGLETGGRVGGTDTVKLLTVHAAKGLEWAVVAVPGLCGGDRAKVFPAAPRMSSAWTSNPRVLPFALRGDRADLPAHSGTDADDLADLKEACAARELVEERRLAYVAVTRAARLLLCSGYWWGEAQSRLGPSVFLNEVREACTGEGGDPPAGEVVEWCPEPAADASNPLLGTAPQQEWPPVGTGPPARVLVAAEQVRAARAAGPGSGAARPADEVAQRWSEEVAALLAERAELGGAGPRPVELPGRLSVSGLVALARDPDGLARTLRRPMPRRPAPLARRGTAFHAWLESRYGQQRLLDPQEMPGSADAGAAGESQLAELQERFLASAWAGRVPVDVEVPFECRVGGVLVRGRMDAVFADHDGGYEVVDWKTGARPGGAEARAASVQLAAYRLAWSALAGVPLEQVRASFHYVRSDETVRPVDLLDAAGLERLVTDLPTA